MMGIFSAFSVVALSYSDVSLQNNMIEAKLTQNGQLVHLGLIGGIPHSFANDSWQVVLSSFNSTDNKMTLEPSTCSTPKQANVTAQSATFEYTCDGTKWDVDVTYSLRTGARFISKSLRVGRSDGKPWSGTINSIDVWHALGLVGGRSVYDGFAATLPFNTDFHPTNSSKKHPRHNGFGVVAEWLGGFYRRGSHMDGLFVTVSNPFGVYSAPNTTITAATNLTARDIPGFEYHVNETCGNDKYQFIHNQTAKECAAACAAEKQCLQVCIRVRG